MLADHPLEELEHLFFGDLAVVVAVREVDEVLGVAHAEPLQDVVVLQGQVDHLGHFAQLELPVFVGVELLEELVDDSSEVLVGYAHF
jgi:hypothetical protein